MFQEKHEHLKMRLQIATSLVTATKFYENPIRLYLPCSVLPHGWGKTGKMQSPIQAYLGSKLQDC